MYLQNEYIHKTLNTQMHNVDVWLMVIFDKKNEE